MQKNRYRPFFHNDGSSAGGYVYFYLNFTDEKKASDFMQVYYKKNPSLKKSDGWLSVVLF